MIKRKHIFAPAALCASMLAAGSANSATLEFQLLTWNDADATAELPSAAGRKPSASMPAAGDWLVFTADDALLAANNNPAGAISHNLVDITGAGGPGFNLAPSLSGTLTLNLESAEGANWNATVTALAYAGQVNVMQAMNQFLVKPGDPATANGAFKVDGSGNSGQWTASASSSWAIQFTLDFYLATNADGDPSPADIDGTLDDTLHAGFLIPVSQLTMEGLVAASLDNPLGFNADDFEQYLLAEIKPRLPGNATYLLITQMGKTHMSYAELGLPVTTNSLVGNTTVAYTTQTLAVPPQVLSLRFEEDRPVLRFTGSPGQAYVLQRSVDLVDWDTVAAPELSHPEPGVAEWMDPDPLNERQFYRVLVLTP